MPFHRRSPTTARPFARDGQRRFHAHGHLSLGPRSLLPPLFLERCVGAYLGPAAAYRLLQRTCDVRATRPGLSFPHGHGRWPRPSSCFNASRTTSSCVNKSSEAVTRGEPRIRPEGPIPVPVPPALHRFARPRYRTDRATSTLLRGGSSVPIDVRGSLDRAKDVSSNRGERAFSRLPSRVRALGARRRRSPPQASRGHPLSPVRSHAGEEPHYARRTDRPRLTFPRKPAKAADIP